jgi:hypothetical protein
MGGQMCNKFYQTCITHHLPTALHRALATESLRRAVLRSNTQFYHNAGETDRDNPSPTREMYTASNSRTSIVLKKGPCPQA